VPTAHFPASCASTYRRAPVDSRRMPFASSNRCRSATGLTDRGVLKQGMWADMLSFDPEQIHDVATFGSTQLAAGNSYLLVNGVLSLPMARPLLHYRGRSTRSGYQPDTQLITTLASIHLRQIGKIERSNG